MTAAIAASSSSGSAIIELVGHPMADTASFFVDTLGFRVTRVFPADDPREIALTGWGLNLLLCRPDDVTHPATGVALRLPAQARPAGGAARLRAPNGVVVDFGARSREAAASVLPHGVEAFVPDDAARWHVGRAGLEYRDLLPLRMGGAVIASQIRLPNGGDVPDYVHYHQVGLQFIYCRRGSIRVVYQDQGDPFEMQAGDCVLQPPGLRHRVLASSPGAEVVELACPAEHQTFGDLELALPNGAARPGQRYGGQAFVWHRADQARRLARADAQGWEWRDTGIADATDGLADTGVWYGHPHAQALSLAPALMHFVFVLEGEVALEGSAAPQAVGMPRHRQLAEGAGVALAPGEALRLAPVGNRPVQVLYTALQRNPVCATL